MPGRIDEPKPQARVVDFDPAVLKAKYLQERDKRLRADGIHQYQQAEGALKHYVEDPYIETSIKREPIEEERDVLVIGGGYGGLLVAGRLANAGITNVRIVEKAGDFGGTWYWNRYPGAACDIESYIYMPFLEDLKYVPTEKYTRAPELLRHAQAIGRHFDLYDKTLFQTEVTNLEWSEAGARWTATTHRGDTIHARFVTSASGPLHKPKFPGVPGIETFQGHSFHTSRWDYEYTGGDTTGDLTKLADKRIGIIGTGATAIQVVPHLGQYAKQLYVFQRTPSSVDYRMDGPTDYAWAQTLTPGWQKARMENFNTIVGGGYQEVDLVADGWTDILRNIAAIRRQAEATKANGSSDANPTKPKSGRAELVQLADFRKMESIRARIDQTVTDPAVAEKLKPWYNQFCKRPCFHDRYLPTFNRPNVTLVDTDGKGVDRITPSGVVANGQEYALDCLIYATGFEVSTDYSQRNRIVIRGRDCTLTEKWSAGMSTLHGMHTRGFPNLFIISTVQAGRTPNYVHVEDEQARHIAYIVSQCHDRSIVAVEASQDAEESWVKEIVRTARRGTYSEECTPGYYNQEGQRNEKAVKASSYGLGSAAFLRLLESWRQEGNMEGLELRPLVEVL